MIRSALTLVVGITLWAGAAWSFDAPTEASPASSVLSASSVPVVEAPEPLVAEPEPAPPEPRVEETPTPQPPQDIVVPFARGYVSFESGAINLAEVAQEHRRFYDCHLALHAEIGAAEGEHRASFLASRRTEAVRRALTAGGMPVRRLVDRGWSLATSDYGRVRIERTGECPQ
ncbi:MAG: hypothetical protein AAGF12_33915 [Myxococcota bacterium]